MNVLARIFTREKTSGEGWGGLLILRSGSFQRHVINVNGPIIIIIVVIIIIISMPRNPQGEIKYEFVGQELHRSTIVLNYADVKHITVRIFTREEAYFFKTT